MSARPAHAPVFGAQARENERLRRVKTRPQLKLVEEQQKRRKIELSTRSRLVVCFGAAAVLLFGLVAFHVLLTQQQFALQKMQSKANAEQAQYERQRLQVAELESPSRITSQAQSLGMVPANKVTPITPGSDQMPRNAAGGVSPVPSDASTSDPALSGDPGNWNSVKPHLNSSTSGQ